METVNLNQLICDDGGVYLFGGSPFSGFAVEIFPDGSLQTQMLLMHGHQDGVTRRWHATGQLESEQGFRQGTAHGTHREWRPDGVLAVQSKWNAATASRGVRKGGHKRMPFV